MTQNGTLEISDVKKAFDQLMPWEQNEFLLKEVDSLSHILDKDDLEGILGCTIVTSAEEAVDFFDEYDILREIPDYTIEQYVTDSWGDPLSRSTKLELFTKEFDKLDGKYIVEDIAAWFVSLSEEDQKTLENKVKEIKEDKNKQDGNKD